MVLLAARTVVAGVCVCVISLPRAQARRERDQFAREKVPVGLLAPRASAKLGCIEAISEGKGLFNLTRGQRLIGSENSSQQVTACCDSAVKIY